VVVRLAPFHRTTEPLTKFVPFTVNVNVGPPAGADAGSRLVVVGSGLGAAAMVNVCAFEVPPLGADVNTVTAAVLAVMRSMAGIEPISCIEDTKVVGRLDPFHRTTEPGTKLLPSTVRLNAGPPALADDGARPLVPGAWLSLVGDRGSQ
jgi:hypothetical protein